MICHFDFECGNITFLKQKKCPVKYQQMEIALLKPVLISATQENTCSKSRKNELEKLEYCPSNLVTDFEQVHA